MRSISNLKYIVGGFVLLLISISYIKKTFEILKSGERLAEVRKEVVNLSSEKENLEFELSYMQSPEYIERSARTELNMVKPNELVFVPETSLKEDPKTLESTLVVSQEPDKSTKDIRKKDSKIGLWLKYFLY